MKLVMKILNKIKNFKRSVKFFWQRLTKGYDDSETWSLDYSLAKIILPRLKRFKKLTIGIPMELTQQEWYDCLDQMIFSFEFLGSESRWSNYDRKTWDKVQAGLDLFAKHYLDLWW